MRRLPGCWPAGPARLGALVGHRLEECQLVHRRGLGLAPARRRGPRRRPRGLGRRLGRGWRGWRRRRALDDLLRRGRRRGRPLGCPRGRGDQTLDLDQPCDLATHGLQLLSKPAQLPVGLLADPVPFVVPELPHGVPDLGLGQLFLGLPALGVELALGGLVPVELLRDGGRVAPQALDHAAKPDLVVRPHLLADGWRCLVRRGVELGEPLLVLGALLQERFDAVVGFRGHGVAFLSGRHDLGKHVQPDGPASAKI